MVFVWVCMWYMCSVGVLYIWYICFYYICGAYCVCGVWLCVVYVKCMCGVYMYGKFVVYECCVIYV